MCCYFSFKYSVQNANKILNEWICSDLDFLLEKGDNLYRNLRKTCSFSYLHPDDLPEGLCFEEKLIKMKIQATYSGDMSILYARVVPLQSVIQMNYYFFDPHARDSNGNPSADGFAVLLSVGNFQQLNNLLRHMYNFEGSCPFDLHKIKTTSVSKKHTNPSRIEFVYQKKMGKCIGSKMNVQIGKID